MVEYGRKMEEEVKAVQNEMKRNVQGTKREGKETGTQVNDQEQKEEIDIQPEQNEETRIQKKLGEAQEPLGQLQSLQHLSHKGARRRGRARN